MTNDAEAVVVFLMGQGIDFTDKRLVYPDTLGTWDELRVEGGRIAGVRHLNAITAERAAQIIARNAPPDPVGLEPLPPITPKLGEGA